MHVQLESLGEDAVVLGSRSYRLLAVAMKVAVFLLLIPAIVCASLIFLSFPLRTTFLPALALPLWFVICFLTARLVEKYKLAWHSRLEQLCAAQNVRPGWIMALAQIALTLLLSLSAPEGIARYSLVLVTFLASALLNGVIGYIYLSVTAPERSANALFVWHMFRKLIVAEGKILVYAMLFTLYFALLAVTPAYALLQALPDPDMQRTIDNLGPVRPHLRGAILVSLKYFWGAFLILQLVWLFAVKFILLPGRIYWLAFDSYSKLQEKNA